MMPRMFWVLGSALAADVDAAIVIQGDADAFVAVQGGEELTPEEFATAVDERAVAVEYARRLESARGYRAVGWGIGGPLLGVGTMAVGVAQSEGDPAAMLAASVALTSGVMFVAAGNTAYLARRHELDRLERWYSLDRAVSLAGAYQPAQGPPSVQVVHVGAGVQAWRDGEQLTTEEFAEAVGDQRVRVRSRATKVLMTTAGVMALVGGYQGVMVAAQGAENGALNDTEVIVGATSAVGVVAGGVLLVYGRKAYADMNNWYTYDEAAAAAGR